MNCPSCGKPVDKKTVFCGFCGAKQENHGAGFLSRNNRIVAAVLACAAVIVLVVALIAGGRGSVKDACADMMRAIDREDSAAAEKLLYPNALLQDDLMDRIDSLINRYAGQKLDWEIEHIGQPEGATPDEMEETLRLIESFCGLDEGSIQDARSLTVEINDDELNLGYLKIKGTWYLASIYAE